MQGENSFLTKITLPSPALSQNLHSMDSLIRFCRLHAWWGRQERPPLRFGNISFNCESHSVFFHVHLPRRFGPFHVTHSSRASDKTDSCRLHHHPLFIKTEETSIDEAHFWLNSYVNKQNCRIWSEANPQVYVETPLHLEKLTVWCALWAGGILLQKR
ncbi:hypothetical protein TNCV_4040551 [Trichonephila clavipes]|nr:hypothetical protein TNCV_4040551 [Trichonephila clavipes]